MTWMSTSDSGKRMRLCFHPPSCMGVCKHFFVCMSTVWGLPVFILVGKQSRTLRKQGRFKKMEPSAGGTSALQH